MPYVSTVALAIDPATQSTLYGGTYGGVHKSTNGGGSWISALSPKDVRTIAIEPSTPSTVYAGAPTGFGGNAFVTKIGA